MLEPWRPLHDGRETTIFVAETPLSWISMALTRSSRDLAQYRDFAPARQRALTDPRQAAGS